VKGARKRKKGEHGGSGGRVNAKAASRHNNRKERLAQKEPVGGDPQRCRGWGGKKMKKKHRKLKWGKRRR